MFDRAEFRLKLIKPMLVFIGLAVLLAALFIGIISWRGATDDRIGANAAGQQ
jgi:hypothetical protein